MLANTYKAVLSCGFVMIGASAALSDTVVKDCTLQEQCFVGKDCKVDNTDAVFRFEQMGSSAVLSLGPQSLSMTLIAEHEGVQSFSVFDPQHNSTGLLTLLPDGRMRVASHDMTRDGKGDFTMFIRCEASAGKKKG